MLNSTEKLPHSTYVKQASDCTLNTSHFSDEQALGLVRSGESFTDIQPLTNHTAGDFAAQHDFNDECEGDNKDSCIEFGGIFDQSCDLYGRIIGHDYECTELVPEYFPHNTPYALIVAFKESLNESGYRADEFSQIAAEFNAAHNTNLTVENLEYVRRTINDNAVLGIGCKNTLEFRHILVGAYSDILEGSKTAKLTSEQAKCLDLIKRLVSAGKLVIDDLYALAKNLANLDKLPRQLTAAKVRKVLGCAEARAEILVLIYNSLPSSPIVKKG